MNAAGEPFTDRLPVADGARSWRELTRACRGHHLVLITAGLLGLLSAAFGLITPAVVGRLVDLIETGSASMCTVVVASTIMVVASIASVVGTALTTVLAARVYQSVLADLRERLAATALAVPQRSVERAGTGDLISRTSDDVTEIADAAPQVVPAFTRSTFTVLVTFAGMAALDWRYAAALAGVLPVYALTLRWYLATAPRIYHSERAAMSGRAQQILESVRGFETVLGFGLAERRHRAVLNSSWTVVAHSLRARTVQNMFFGRLNLAEYLGLSAILATGFLLIHTGYSTVGAATTAALLFLRLFGPINQLLFVVDVLQSVLASLNRMVGVLTLQAPVQGTAPAGARSAQNVAEEVRLDGITFAYNGDRPVLAHIELTIAAGERVAIVGASGAGKSTLAGIVAGLHDPQTGTVFRPRDIAVITQESHVFAGTLRDNLTLAAPGAPDGDLMAALEATGASALLERLPHGLDSRIGLAGHMLSAAQAQQIALARVVLADPQLAILDEATAEAGSAQAEALDRAVEAVLHGRTGLIIAHRLPQAAACDRIVVLDGGRIVQEGTHAVLLATDGVYSRLWESWVRLRPTA